MTVVRMLLLPILTHLRAFHLASAWLLPIVVVMVVSMATAWRLGRIEVVHRLSHRWQGKSADGQAGTESC
jgi:hypothetical protein